MNFAQQGIGAFGLGRQMAEDMRQRARAERVQQSYDSAGSAFARGDAQGGTQALYATGQPQAIAGAFAMQGQAQRQEASQQRQVQGQTLRFMQAIKQVPAAQRAAFMAEAGPRFQSATGVDVGEIGEDMLQDSELDGNISALSAALGGQGGPKGEAFTLSPGEQRFSASGEQIASGGAKAPDLIRVNQPDGQVVLFDKTSGRTTQTGLQARGQKGLESAFEAERGKGAHKLMTDIRAAGMDSRREALDLDLASDLLKQIDYTGFGGDALLTAQKVGSALGFEVGDDIPAKEALQTITGKLAVALKADLPGPMSDADRKFLLSIPPSLNKSKKGNILLVFMTKRRAEYQQRMYDSLVDASPKTANEYYEWEQSFEQSQPPLFTPKERQAIASVGGSKGG